MFLTFVSLYVYDSRRFKMKESDQALYVLPFTGIFLYLLIVDYPIQSNVKFCFQKDNDRYVYLDKEIKLYKEQYILNKIFTSGLLNFEKIKKIKCTGKEEEAIMLFNLSKDKFYKRYKTYWKTKEGKELRERNKELIHDAFLMM
jgi:hypothetical protein